MLARLPQLIALVVAAALVCTAAARAPDRTSGGADVVRLGDRASHAQLADTSILTATGQKIDLDSTSIPELQVLMDDGELTSVKIMRFYLKRIERLDPRLHAVLAVNPKAVRHARATDRARADGVQAPLLGIPLLVKDNVNTTGMPTTAGSWALAESDPADAFVIDRLQGAGAVIIGKSNLSEWANFRSSPSSSGWTGIGGQTNMPYVLNRNPCGSSSGSAAGTSANLATAAVGSETDGSIMCPSGTNGVVAIKPTLGLASRTGVIPISTDQDTLGPIARNVTDAAVLLGAMTGIDDQDPFTADQEGHVTTDYTAFLDAGALDDARIGVWRDGVYDPADNPDVHRVLDDAVAVLEALGAVIVEDVRIPWESASSPAFAALKCEFKTDVAQYLATYTDAGYPKTLADLIAFNGAHPDLEGPWNSLIFQLAQQTNGRGAACAQARARAKELARAAVDDTLADDDLDAVIAPTNGPAWVTDPVLGDLHGDFTTFVSSSSPAAIAGYPNVTVPAGYAGPVPIGVSFIGGRWAEPSLLGYAYAFEQATKVRVPPQFLSPVASGWGPSE